MIKSKTVPGIDDSEFIRAKVPMTKEEIRVLAISKMKINHDSIIVDAGAGTGSVSIECALIADKGKVYAYEKNADAVKLINANKEKFSVENLKIIEGEAPGIIHVKEKIDAMFIGGGGGNIPDIIKTAASLLKPDGRIVINAVLLETLSESIKCLEQNEFRNINYCQVQINRGRRLGKGHSLEALNPVYIIWGEK